MLVTFCSLKGSPGATTAAIAVATRWPGEQTPVVVECDPAGGDLAARFRLPSTPGVVSLAAAARSGSSDATVLWQHVHHLPGGLAVVPGPVNAEQARAALDILVCGRGSVLRAAADQPGVVVLADCGRVDPGSAALPIIRAADVMVLFAHARDDELSHVAGKLRTAATWNSRRALVLVGAGYSTAEVERELQVGVMGRIPHDPDGAAVLCGGHRGGPGPDRSALGRAAGRLAQAIATVSAGSIPPPGAPAPVSSPQANRPATTPGAAAVSPSMGARS